MSDHIVELLRKRRERSLKMKESFKAMKAEELENKAASVKRILGGAVQYSAVPVNLTILRDLYFQMIQTYTGKEQYYSADMSDRHVALWIRVEKARCRVGCDPERFLKAQFVWFDKAFGAAPTTRQLATDAAVERALEFTGSTEGKVLGNIRKAPVSKADVFRESEKTLQRMMAAQECDREEFYRKFVLTGLFSFPKEFLKADPAYQRVMKECQTETTTSR